MILKISVYRLILGWSWIQWYDFVQVEEYDCSRGNYIYMTIVWSASSWKVSNWCWRLTLNKFWVDAKVTHNVELKLFLEWLDINIHCTNNVVVLLNVGCLKKKFVDLKSPVWIVTSLGVMYLGGLNRKKIDKWNKILHFEHNWIV